jgi:hypothetical protein
MYVHREKLEMNVAAKFNKRRHGTQHPFTVSLHV